MRIFDWGNPKREFCAVAFDPTGRLLAAGGGQKATPVWEVTTGAELARLRPIALSLQFHSPSGRLILTTKVGLTVMDVNTGATTAHIPGWYPKPPAVAPDDDWIAYYSDIGGRGLLTAQARFNTANAVPLWSVPAGESAGEVEHTVYLSCVPNREHFLSGEYRTGPTYEQSRRIALRSRANGRVLQSWTGEVFGYGDRLFGSHLSDAVVVQNGVWLRVHRIDDMAAPPRVVRNDNRKHFTALAFHPSGRYLAATSNDETVKLYDTTTWEVARTFTWDIGRMRSIAFSHDGTLAAAGGDSGKVVVWDVDL